VVSIAKPLLANEKLEKVIEILLVLFGLYLLIQILQKILGGSWSTEDIIIALLIFNLGATFTITIALTQLKSDYSHLKEQFKSLATDFKKYVGKK